MEMNFKLAAPNKTFWLMLLHKPEPLMLLLHLLELKVDWELDSKIRFSVSGFQLVWHYSLSIVGKYYNGPFLWERIVLHLIIHHLNLREPSPVKLWKRTKLISKVRTNYSISTIVSLFPPLPVYLYCNINKCSILMSFDRITFRELLQ